MLGATLALLNGAANPAADASSLPLGAALAAIDQMALGLLVGGGAALGVLLHVGRKDAPLAAGEASFVRVHPRSPAPELAARFRSVALGCLVALAASALTMAALRFAAPAALPATPFGLALVAKLTALLVAALLARAAARRGNATLWRAAGVAGGGALALAGLLASLP